MTRCRDCLSHHEPAEPCPAAHGFGYAFAELPEPPVVHAGPETRALVQALTAGLPRPAPAPPAAPAAPAPPVVWYPEISPEIERWQRRTTWLGRFIFAPRPRGYVRRVMLRELVCKLRRRHRWEPVEGFTVLRCAYCWRWNGT